MKPCLRTGLAVAVLIGALAAGAAETLPELKVGEDVYRNVTITSTNATDIYFTHSGGMGNAKIKKLAPELQKRFGFDAAKAAEEEKKQRDANARFNQIVASQPKTAAPSVAVPAEQLPTPTYDNGDVVAGKLYAKSFRGRPAPPVGVAMWATDAPDANDMKTKFVLLVFWLMAPPPSRAAAPRMSQIADKYRDRMVVVALTKETEEQMRKEPPLRMSFHVGMDPEARTYGAFGVHGIPHAVLIDRKGIVRYEGPLPYLDDEAIEHLLTRYAQ